MNDNALWQTNLKHRSEIFQLFFNIFSLISTSRFDYMGYTRDSLLAIYVDIYDFFFISKFFNIEVKCLRDTFIKIMRALYKAIAIKESEKYSNFQILNLGRPNLALEQCSETRCTMCFDVRLSDVDYVMLDACSHLYCKPCIHAWFKKGKR